jgi:8-oxo-dGTP pyrophosphatase MutT (NUDIX family)
MKDAIMTMLYKLAYQAHIIRSFLLKPITAGVKILLIKEGKVLLVHHTYKKGWYLPGGGVKRGETLEQAARREAAEEVGASLDELQLFGLYSNLTKYQSDHVTVFLCRSFSLSGQSDFEIERFGFFSPDYLPADTAPGDRHRIEEYKQGALPHFALW